MRRTLMFFPLLPLASLLLAATPTQAEVKPGADFDYLSKVMPTETSTRVEVIEFFWYGSPYCYRLEPRVEAWVRTLPKDVSFRREHVAWANHEATQGHAKLFAALKTMGLVENTITRVFDAIHKDRVQLLDPRTLYPWIAKQGIDRARFELAYNSFGAQGQLNRANRLSSDYKIAYVPVFIVNGKYMTSLSKVHSEDRLFEVVNELIARERAR